VDLELPTVLHAIIWEKLYEVPHSGSCLLTLEFLTTFEFFARGRKSYVHFAYSRESSSSTTPDLVSY
jgi:hypothetical protein